MKSQDDFVQVSCQSGGNSRPASMYEKFAIPPELAQAQQGCSISSAWSNFYRGAFVVYVRPLGGPTECDGLDSSLNFKGCCSKTPDPKPVLSLHLPLAVLSSLCDRFSGQHSQHASRITQPTRFQHYPANTLLNNDDDVGVFPAHAGTDDVLPHPMVCQRRFREEVPRQVSGPGADIPEAGALQSGPTCTILQQAAPGFPQVTLILHALRA